MKRVGIREVAKAAGVSITTVSRALNGYDDVSSKTRAQIQEVARQLHYAPDVNARSLGGMSEKTIALVVSDLQPRDESGMAFGIISGMYQASVDYNFDFTLFTTNTVKQERLSFMQLCFKKNIDGVVIMGIRTDDPYYQEVIDSTIPCALIDIDVQSEHTCNISVDNISASEEAVNYLIAQGHKNIAMLNGQRAVAVAQERFNGYANAFYKNSMILKPEYLIDGEFKEEKAYQETKKLLKDQPEVTALFCASDLMAIGAIKAIHDVGKKVPQDISVIGFDDIPIAAHIYGGITTVHQSPFEMGKMAGEAVYKMLTNEEPVRLIAPYEFIIRGTVMEV